MRHKYFGGLLLFLLFILSPCWAFADSGPCTYFSEDFSGLSADTWSFSYGNWYFQGEKLEVDQIPSGKMAHAEASFYPDELFTLDVDVEKVSLPQGGAYGIYPHTTAGDLYLAVDGKTLDGVGVLVFDSGNAFLIGYDVVGNAWYKSVKYPTTGAVSSIGVVYSNDAITLRINKQNTSLKFSGDFTYSFWTIDTLWLMAQGEGTHMRFDNVCSDPLKTTPIETSYTLIVTTSGTGSGTVTRSPSSCTNCSEIYNKGTIVTLTATPYAGSTFSGWSGGGCSGTGTCTVTMNADTTVTATFSKITNTVQTPQNLRYTLNGTMLTIAWDAAAGAAGYKAGLGTQSGIYSGPYDVGNINQIGPFDVSTLSGTFYLAVKAYNGSQESGYSNEIIITFTASAFSAPTNLRYTLNGTMLTINWDAVAGATGYKVGLGTQSGIYSGPYDVDNITQIGPIDIKEPPPGTYLAVKAYDGSRESGYSNEINVMAVFTIMTNPTDGQLLTARGNDGTTVHYYGTRNADGIPTDINRIQVIASDGSTTRIELDSAKRPVKMRSPDGVVFELDYFGGNQAVVTAISPDGLAVVNTGFNSSSAVNDLQRIEAKTAYAMSGGEADWVIRVTKCGLAVEDAFVWYSIEVPGWISDAGHGEAKHAGGGSYVASIPTGLKPSLTPENIRSAAESVAQGLGTACDVLGLAGTNFQNMALLGFMCPAITVALTSVTGPGGVAIGTACNVVTKAVLLYCVTAGISRGPIGTATLAEEIFQGLKDPKVLTSNITLKAGANIPGVLGNNVADPVVDVPSNGPFPTTTIAAMLPDEACNLDGSYNGSIVGKAPGTIKFRVSGSTMTGTISGSYEGDAYSGKVGGTVSPDGSITGGVSGVVTHTCVESDPCDPHRYPFSGLVNGRIIVGRIVEASGSWDAAGSNTFEMGTWNATKF